MPEKEKPSKSLEEQRAVLRSRVEALKLEAIKTGVDLHTLSKVRQVDILLEEGEITPEEYEKSIRIIAQRTGYNPKQISPGIDDGSGWHFYSASIGLDAGYVQLIADGHAGWGVNRAGRVVPIDGVTQVWETLEHTLQRAEEMFHVALGSGYSHPLVSSLRGLYDTLAPGIARTYPLMGRLFEVTTPALAKFLQHLPVDASSAYQPDNDEITGIIADVVLAVEEGRHPLYFANVATPSGFSEPTVLVYPVGFSYAENLPLWLHDGTQADSLRRWLAPTNPIMSGCYDNPERMWHDYPNMPLPVALLSPAEASRRFTRPNGVPFTPSDFNRLPSLDHHPLWEGGSTVDNSDLFVPHLAAIGR